MSEQGPHGRRAQGGRERVKLHHIGPRREVRVAAVGQDVPGGPHPGRRLGLDVSLAAIDEQLRVGRHPGMVGRDVVGHIVQEQPDAAGGQRGPRFGEGLGAAERVVDDIPAHAVRRSDHVVRPYIRQRVTEGGLQPRVRVGQLEAGRASLPHPHQPHRVGACGRDIVPGGGRHVSQRHPPPGGPRQVAQPDRGVDLVDHRLVRPPGHRRTPPGRRPWGRRHGRRRGPRAPFPAAARWGRVPGASGKRRAYPHPVADAPQ